MTNSVVELLNKHKLSFSVSGKDYLIRCLNPEHPDNNPSLRVDQITGVSHCFSCGWKRNLFKHFNIRMNQTPIKVRKLKEKLEELAVSVQEVKLPDDATPFTRSYRGISASTYKHFEAFYTNTSGVLPDRIIFPIKDFTGKVAAMIGRHMDQHQEPRYKNHPPKASIPCFPLRFDKSYDHAILVEGVFDMLNLYDKGIKNAVCCAGTQTLVNNTKYKLMPLQAQGIHKLYLMFDGDEPGRKAAKELRPLLEECGYTVEIINLPENSDPGDMSQEDVDSIKEYVSNENSDNRQSSVAE